MNSCRERANLVDAKALSHAEWPDPRIVQLPDLHTVAEYEAWRCLTGGMPGPQDVFLLWHVPSSSDPSNRAADHCILWRQEIALLGEAAGRSKNFRIRTWGACSCRGHCVSIPAEGKDRGCYHLGSSFDTIAASRT